MLRNGANFALLLCLAIALSMSAQADQQDQPKRSLVNALDEGVPPVGIYAKHVIFNRFAEIESLASLDEQGNPTEAPVSLRAIASGVVIDSSSRARRVDLDDPIAAGDLIVGGVFRNSGKLSVQINFSHGDEMTLKSGEVFYVGTHQRLLRPDQIPCGQPPERIPASCCEEGSATHCLVCACQCEHDGGRCEIMMDTDRTTDCRMGQAVACVCPDGAEGKTADCVKTAVPKNQRAAAR